MSHPNTAGDRDFQLPVGLGQDKEAATKGELMTRYEVHAEGIVVGRYEDREDAEGFAAVWNEGYKPDEGYPEFVVVTIGATDPEAVA